MKIKMDIDESYDDIEITIKASALDDDVNRILSLIKNNKKNLSVRKDERSYSIHIEDIYYIESIDDKTFIYLEKEVYEINKRLYELENEYLSDQFIRVSKSTILNIDNLASVSALLNGKFEAYMNNEERIIISRHYVPEFKKKFGIGG